jgi:protein-S-isoprenylcysteine O-methyltransferase Ste14
MDLLGGLRDPAVAAHRGYWLASVGRWAAFSLYWEKAAKSAAAAKSAETKGSRAVHVIAVNAALLLVVLPLRFPGRLVPASAAMMAAGLAVEAAGLLLAVWARRHLGRNWSGEISIKVDHELVRTGPYRMLRHPIYVGILLMYAGAALVTGGWLGAMGVALALAAYARKVRLEEANLRAAFGSAWDDYRQSTR